MLIIQGYIIGHLRNSKVMTELRAVIEEYEDDISLKHIGFPQDWYEQL